MADHITYRMIKLCFICRGAIGSNSDMSLIYVVKWVQLIWVATSWWSDLKYLFCICLGFNVIIFRVVIRDRSKVEKAFSYLYFGSPYGANSLRNRALISDIHIELTQGCQCVDISVT